MAYEADAAVFHPAPSPTTAEVQFVVNEVRERVERSCGPERLVDHDARPRTMTVTVTVTVTAS